jgi:hypothetical protein
MEYFSIMKQFDSMLACSHAMAELLQFIGDVHIPLMTGIAIFV